MHVAGVVLVGLPPVTTVFCVVGTNHYSHVHWQDPKKIAMFKMLNREIPPHKGLLTFERSITDQHPVKGAHYRPEVAYNLDREIVHA